MKCSTTCAAIAGAVVLLGSLAGCGGDDSGGSTAAAPEPTESSTEDYCTSIEDAKEQFQSLGENQLGNFEEAFGTLRDLQGQAPEEVAADWETLIGGIEKVEQAVADAGLTFDQLAEISANPNDLPEGVDLAKLQQLGAEMQQLGTTEFQQAGEAISKHAENECGITLDDSASATPEPPTE